MGEITIDGLTENGFRRSIETMLRHGRADEAADRLRVLLEPYAREGAILPPRFLDVSAADIGIAGWQCLGERIREYDRPGHAVSAIGITLVEPVQRQSLDGEPGGPVPNIETSYFTDEAYPFSEAARRDLLEGYSLSGCEWEGDCEETDSTLSFQGIDDLYGALVRLESKLMNGDEPDEEEIRAGSLGSCYLLTLMHQAVREKIRNDGLPRTLCVMAGSNGVYPFFDAPVMSSEEYVRNRTVTPITITGAGQRVLAAAHAPEPASVAGPAEFESLLNIGIRKGRKKPVIVLEPDDASASMDWPGTARLDGDAGRIVPIGPPREREANEGLVADAPAFIRHDTPDEPDAPGDAAGFGEPAGPVTHDPVLDDAWRSEKPGAVDKARAAAQPLTSLPLPPPPQPASFQPGHSLRSQITETRRPAERSTSRVAAALRRLAAAVFRL